MNRTSSRVICLAAVCMLTAACEKKDAADAVPDASASAVASASAAPVPEKPWFVGQWRASFDVERHQMEMKKAEGMVKDWENDQGKEGIGKASLEMSIDESGKAEGKLTGALGEISVSGVLEEETLRLKLVARNATDPAVTFNGVIVATKKGDAFSGALKASSGDSLKVRKADLVISKATPAGSR